MTTMAARGWIFTKTYKVLKQMVSALSVVEIRSDIPIVGRYECHTLQI